MLQPSAAMATDEVPYKQDTRLGRGQHWLCAFQILLCPNHQDCLLCAQIVTGVNSGDRGDLGQV